MDNVFVKDGQNDYAGNLVNVTEIDVTVTMGTPESVAAVTAQPNRNGQVMVLQSANAYNIVLPGAVIADNNVVFQRR
jgi:hypothetical protein